MTWAMAGDRETLPNPFDSMLSRVVDPERVPEILLLREEIRSWRFYDHFRTDVDSVARQPQIGRARRS
ncbi:MAG: hypothetical protein CM1200mP9_04000 [Gammaproteobacteria bacterium]|nr:MAG: hypothetical protein CM1200mP9_04000 [Gammaproteobacteria bacterium]